MPTDQNGCQHPQRSVPHPKRTYEPKRQHPRKDIDSADLGMKVKALFWSVGAVAIGFAALGLAGGGAVDPTLLMVIRAGIIASGVVVYFLSLAIARSGGNLAGTIYHPSGKSTPVKHEYSYAESLAARGSYEDAVTAYEVAVSEFPEDPEPYIRIARLYRDRLADHEVAAHWFKRARKDAEISKGQELLVTQELIEIYSSRLDTPTRAIPELARILDRFPEDQVADWARQEMQTLKERVVREENERAGRGS